MRDLQQRPHRRRGQERPVHLLRLSLLKRGRGTCTTPRLNAPRFERLIVEQIRAHILTERNIRDLVRLVDEEMDGVAREQRQKLATIEQELAEVRRRLDRVWHVIEITNLGLADASTRIREYRERQRRLELAAEETQALLAERRVLLGKVETIAAYARDMSDFLMTSELTEAKAFIRSFVKEISVRPETATIHYMIPTPGDSLMRGANAAEVELRRPVMNTVPGGGESASRMMRLRQPAVRPVDVGPALAAPAGVEGAAVATPSSRRPGPPVRPGHRPASGSAVRRSGCGRPLPRPCPGWR